MAAARGPVDDDRVFDAIWTRFEEGRVIPQCAWCGRVHLGERWLHPPVGALLSIDARLTMSHSICPDCNDLTRRQSAHRA